MKREIIQQTYTYRSCDKHILQAKCLKGWCTCSTWSRRFLKFSLRYVSTLVMMPSSLILSFSNCLLSCKWIKTSKHKSYLCDIFTMCWNTSDLIFEWVFLALKSLAWNGAVRVTDVWGVIVIYLKANFAVSAFINILTILRWEQL